MGGQLLKPVAQWPSDLILCEEEVKKNLGERKKLRWCEHVLEQDEKYNYRFACNLQINSSYDKLVFGAGCQSNTWTFSIFPWATTWGDKWPEMQCSDLFLVKGIFIFVKVLNRVLQKSGIWKESQVKRFLDFLRFLWDKLLQNSDIFKGSLMVIYCMITF